MPQISADTEEQIIKWLSAFVHLDNEEIDQILRTYSSSIVAMKNRNIKESVIAVALMMYGQKQYTEIQAFAETKEKYL